MDFIQIRKFTFLKNHVFEMEGRNLDECQGSWRNQTQNQVFLHPWYIGSFFSVVRWHWYLSCCVWLPCNTWVKRQQTMVCRGGDQYIPCLLASDRNEFKCMKWIRISFLVSVYHWNDFINQRSIEFHSSIHSLTTKSETRRWACLCSPYALSRLSIHWYSWAGNIRFK